MEENSGSKHWKNCLPAISDNKISGAHAVRVLQGKLPVRVRTARPLCSYSESTLESLSEISSNAEEVVQMSARRRDQKR